MCTDPSTTRKNLLEQADHHACVHRPFITENPSRLKEKYLSWLPQWGLELDFLYPRCSGPFPCHCAQHHSGSLRCSHMRSGCPRDICSSGLGTQQQSLWVILARGSMLGSHSWHQPPQCLPWVVLTPCNVTSPLFLSGACE